MAQTPATQQPPQHPTVMAVQQLLGANIKAIQSCLPKHMTPERMCRVAFNTVQKTPALLNCSPQSLVAAIVEASSLGLEIDSRGQAYLVPYGKNVTLIPGYKGLMDLAYRSGRVTSIYADVVCANDTFEFAMGLDAKLVHVPNLEDRGELKAAYAVAKIKDSDPAFVVLGKTEIEKVKKASKAAANGPWKDWEEEMWKKTAIRRLCKCLPLSPEMQRAVFLDEMGDAGKAQDLGVGLIDIDPEPQADGNKAPAIDMAALDRFNKLAGEFPDEDIERLADFIDITAKANGADAQAVKAAAAGDFGGFKASFDAWKEKNPAEDTYLCPDRQDGTRFAASVCAKCPKAKNCPEYAPSHP